MQDARGIANCELGIADCEIRGRNRGRHRPVREAPPGLRPPDMEANHDDRLRQTDVGMTPGVLKVLTPPSPTALRQGDTAITGGVLIPGRPRLGTA